MSLGKRKSTRKEYHIPNDIKAHITKEFGREFLNQLECVYSKNEKAAQFWAAFVLFNCIVSSKKEEESCS